MLLLTADQLLSRLYPGRYTLVREPPKAPVPAGAVVIWRSLSPLPEGADAVAYEGECLLVRVSEELWQILCC